MGCHFVEVENWTDASVATLEVLTPGLAVPRAKNGCQPRLLRGPQRRVILGVEQGVVEQTEPLTQGPIEGRLDRTHGQPAPVSALIAAVVVRAAVQPIGSARAVPSALRAHPLEDAHEGDAAVSHGSIHNLAAARTLGFMQRSQNTEQQQHGAAAKVTHQVQWRYRRAACWPDAGQCTGERDVVDVVPRC